MKDTLDRSLLKSIWSILSWMVLALLVCAVLAGVYFYYRADDELKAYVESQIAQHYPQLTVSINEVRLLRNEGIRIRGISLVQPSQAKRPRSEPVFIDEILLRCSTNISTLLKGDISIQRVHMRGLVLRGIRRADGYINLKELVPQNFEKGHCRRIPIFSIEDSTIEFIDRMSTLTKLVTLRRVQMKVVPNYAANQPETAGSLSIEASFQQDDLHIANFVGSVNLVNGSWDAHGTANGLRLTPSLYRTLPPELASIRDLAEPFRATSNLTIKLSSPSYSDIPRFVIDGKIIDGRYSLPRHAHAITDISADIRFENRSLQITDLEASFGMGRIKLSLQRGGYQHDSPMSINLQTTNFLVDRSLITLLPDSTQRMWQKFRPLGRVSGTAFVSYNGSKWNYDADLNCKDTGLQYHRFQYPITNVSGDLSIKRGKLSFDLVGATGNTPVTVVGSWLNPGPRTTGWCQVNSKEWMPIDDHLLKAVQDTYPNASKIVRQLNPRGEINVAATFRKRRPEDDVAKQIAITIRDGWMKYEKFPYPINEIQGQILLDGSEWQFNDFKGYNDSCMITCNGTLNPQKRFDQLDLDFAANKIALDDELKTALPTAMRRIWLDLRPQGTIDLAKIEVRHTEGEAAPVVGITASKFDRESDQGLSVKPRWFPYRLEQISGHAVYKNGQVVVTRLAGSNEATSVSANMTAKFDNRGTWRVQLDQFSARGLQTNDHALIEALPSGLATAVSALAVRGNLAAYGTLNFSGTTQNEATQNTWDLRMDLDQIEIQPGIAVDNIHGAVRLRGQSYGDSIRCRGDLDVQSAMYQGFHFHDIQGPIWFSGSKVFGGSVIPVGPQQPKLPSIRAKVHDGSLEFDFDVNLLEQAPSFSMAASLNNADLASFARDNIPNNADVKGKASGRLNLNGNASGTHTLLGKGNVKISDANLYELPLILALLKRLRYGADDAAVLTANMNFNVEGENVYFGLQRPNQQNTDAGITISGDAVTLKGTGRVGFNRDVELEFYTLVGREKLWNPVIRPIVGEASRQFLKIRVDGTLDQPLTHQEVLPGFNDSIRFWFPELSNREGNTQQRDAKKRFSLRRSKLR